MCIAIPMQVLRRQDMFAWCRGRGQQRHVNLALVGEVSEGAWVLVHLDIAREVIEPERVEEINRALDAVEQAMYGEFEAGMFDDLLNREPQLPEFLRPSAEQDKAGEEY
jgi:hydrogenase expression/formation protein HypC